MAARVVPGGFLRHRGGDRRYRAGELRDHPADRRPGGALPARRHERAVNVHPAQASRVAFSAGEDACAPMTWGQRAIWEPLQWFGDDTAQFNNPRSVTLA